MFSAEVENSTLFNKAKKMISNKSFNHKTQKKTKRTEFTLDKGSNTKLNKSKSSIIEIKDTKNAFVNYNSCSSHGFLKLTPYQIIHSNLMMEKKIIEEKKKNFPCIMKAYSDKHFQFFPNKVKTSKPTKLKFDNQKMRLYFNKYTLYNPKLSLNKSASIPSYRSQERKILLKITKIKKNSNYCDKSNLCSSTLIKNNVEEVFYNQGD